jgi:prepilin-type N-terminal cleavage/methylation domain-containing protein
VARDDERGFTIVELLVVILLLSLVLTAFYQVLFSATSGSETSQNLARVSEEARLGFNRMVRDAREGNGVFDPSATSFTVEIDFDGDNAIATAAPDPLGSYERITYSYDAATQTIRATTYGVTEVLMTGVTCVKKANNTCEDIFTFTSSRLEYDTLLADGVTAGSDGVVSAKELDVAPTIGNNNLASWTDTEERFIDRVTFALKVTQGSSSTDFHADAQLRNRR